MKRRYRKRIPLKASVMFSNDQLSGHGRVLDITAPGCQIESVERFLKGQYVQLQLALPGLPSPFTVKLAAVRWTKGHRCGVEFIKMTRLDQVILDAFVADHLAGLTTINAIEGENGTNDIANEQREDAS